MKVTTLRIIYNGNLIINSWFYSYNIQGRLLERANGVIPMSQVFGGLKSGFSRITKYNILIDVQYND